MANQVEGEMYQSITGQLFEIGRQLRQPNGYPFDPQRLRVALQNAIEGKFAQQRFFTVVAINKLAAIVAKKTAQCFTGDIWVERDRDCDNWLPSDQPTVDACTISTLKVEKGWTFAEVARALPGVEQTMDIAALGRSLIKNRYTMVLQQIEDLVERNNRRVDTGLHTPYGNFFFIETGNEENPVRVGSVTHPDRGWHAILRGFEDVHRRDAAVHRFLVPNLDALKL